MISFWKTKCKYLEQFNRMVIVLKLITLFRTIQQFQYEQYVETDPLNSTSLTQAQDEAWHEVSRGASHSSDVMA